MFLRIAFEGDQGLLDGSFAERVEPLKLGLCSSQTPKVFFRLGILARLGSRKSKIEAFGSAWLEVF